MARFPVNGTPAEQAAHMREWGCGGCQRGAKTIDALAERLAEAERVVSMFVHAYGVDGTGTDRVAAHKAATILLRATDSAPAAPSKSVQKRLAVQRGDAETAPAAPTPKVDCPKCGGEGWLWWNELDEYSGPAIETGQDDTRYSCDGEAHRATQTVDAAP